MNLQASLRDNSSPKLRDFGLGFKLSIDNRQQSTTTPKKGGLNCDPKRVEVMNCYFTTETQRSQRNDFLFCFSLRRRKAKSIHLQVSLLKAMPYSIIAQHEFLKPQLQLPSGFSSPSSQRRWKKIPSSAFSVPQAKRAVMSYSRTYPHSKAGTIPLQREGLRS